MRPCYKVGCSILWLSPNVPFLVSNLPLGKGTTFAELQVCPPSLCPCTWYLPWTTGIQPWVLQMLHSSRCPFDQLRHLCSWLWRYREGLWRGGAQCGSMRDERYIQVGQSPPSQLDNHGFQKNLELENISSILTSPFSLLTHPRWMSHCYLKLPSSQKDSPGKKSQGWIQLFIGFIRKWSCH